MAPSQAGLAPRHLNLPVNAGDTPAGPGPCRGGVGPVMPNLVLAAAVTVPAEFLGDRLQGATAATASEAATAGATRRVRRAGRRAQHRRHLTGISEPQSDTGHRRRRRRRQAMSLPQSR